MSAVKKYLLSQEWSMGNGQCPVCTGLSPDFPKRIWYDGTAFDDVHGHKRGCILARAMEDVGLITLYAEDW